MDDLLQKRLEKSTFAEQLAVERAQVDSIDVTAPGMEWPDLAGRLHNAFLTACNGHVSITQYTILRMLAHLSETREPEQLIRRACADAHGYLTQMENVANECA